MLRRCGASQVSGSTPSRPADGELPHRDSSCLLLPLRCGGHFWLALCLSHRFLSSVSVLSLSLSRLLHPVLKCVRAKRTRERSSETTPLLSDRRDHVEEALRPYSRGGGDAFNDCRKYWFQLWSSRTEGSGLSKMITFQITVYSTGLWMII